MIQKLVDNAILGFWALMVHFAVMTARMLDWRPRAQHAEARRREPPRR